MLGFDYGRRRIGIAVGETLTRSARALVTVHADRRGTPPWKRLETLVAEWRPGRLVVGLPCHLDGREAQIAATVRAFSVELARRTGRPVALWNEALSTEAARAGLAAGNGGTRGDKGRDRLNAEAAREILSGWLAARRDE